MHPKHEFIWVMVGRLIHISVGIISIRLMSHFLPPSEYGLYALWMAYYSAFGLSLMSPVGNFINRRLFDWLNMGCLRQCFGVYHKFLLLVSSFAFGLGLFVWWLQGIPESVFLVSLLVAGFFYSSSLNQTLIPTLNLLGSRAAWAQWTAVSGLISLTLAATFAFFVPSAKAWLLGQSLGLGIAAVGAGWALLKLIPDDQLSTKPADTLWTVWQFSWPLSISTVLFWTQFQGYRFIFADSFGLETLGLFAATYAVSSGVITAAEGFVMTYALPHFYRAIAEASISEKGIALSRYLLILISMLMLAWVFVSLFSESLLSLLLDRRYRVLSYIIPITAAIESLRAISSGVSLAAHVTLRTRSLLLPQLIGVLVLVVLAVPFGSFFGLQGLLAAMFIAAGSLVLSVVIAMKRELNLSLQPSDLRPLLIPLMLIGLTAIAGFFTRTHISEWVWVGLAGIIAARAAFSILSERDGQGRKVL